MVWSLFIIDLMGLFFYTKIGSIISIGDLPTTNSIEPLKWIADKVSGWGDHYQLVAQKLVLKRAISKPVLEKHGLVSCLDYYLERHALKVS